MQACRREPSAGRRLVRVDGLMTFLTYASAMFVGSLICGRIVDMYATPGPGGAVLHNWRNIWMVPALGAAWSSLIFWAGFRNEDRAADAQCQKAKLCQRVLSEERPD